MRTSAVILALPVAAMALATRKPDVVARALYPRQSAACTYTCPEEDMMETKSSGSLNTGSTLYCFYGAEECEYNSSTGGLISSFGGTSCPTIADATGCGRRRAYKREDNYTAMLRRKVAREEAERMEDEAKRAAEEAKRAVKEAERAEGVAKRAVQEAESTSQDARRADEVPASAGPA